MFIYYFKLALLNLRHKLYLSLLMVLLISIGVSAPITITTMIYNMSADPYPKKSKQLHFIQMDNQNIDRPETKSESDLTTRLTYRDASYLYHTETPATQQTMVFEIDYIIDTEQQDSHPFFLQESMATTHDFFEMFEIPFLYGGGWDKKMDDSGEAVIVITKELNDKLYGGEDSVGRKIKVQDDYATIVGVIGAWYPSSTFYDTTMDPSDSSQSFVPIQFAINLNIAGVGAELHCPDSDRTAEQYRWGNSQGLINSECSWIILWTELESTQAVNDYEELLNHYVNDQKVLGRFPRPINNFTTSIREWIGIRSLVPNQFMALLVIASLFLVVCLCNTNSIVLSKLISRYQEIGLRRALGANKISIFSQQILEISCIGFVGGLLATAFARMELVGMRFLLEKVIDTPTAAFDSVFILDVKMMIICLMIAIFSAMIVSIIPVWRVCNTSPSMYLKSQ